MRVCNLLNNSRSSKYIWRNKNLFIFFMEQKSEIDQGNIIEEVNTFIFNMPVEYSLGHCVAKDMRMSAGIAIYFKSIFERVGELMDQRPNVGNVAYLQQNDRFIYYLISKELSNGKPTYESLTSAITELRDFIVKHGVKKLAIPRIGCGLDKLEWCIVKNIIKGLFQGIGCEIKVCHFTQNMSNEKDLLHIYHPSVLRTCQNVKDIKRREFEKLNIILYSQNTNLVYWDENFQSVNKKYHFKSHYYKDYKINLEPGQCLHYETIHAHIYVIITNENRRDHFSYQNLESGLTEVRSMIQDKQWHPTFIVHKVNNPVFEKLINRKIISLICSVFLNLTPCLIIEVDNI